MASLDWLKAHYCPICGREFYPTPMWAYKDLDNIYCSYRCLRKVETEVVTVKKNTKDRAVEKLSLSGDVLDEFGSIDDAVAHIDGTNWGIRKACRDGIPYKKYLWRYKE